MALSGNCQITFQAGCTHSHCTPCLPCFSPNNTQLAIISGSAFRLLAAAMLMDSPMAVQAACPCDLQCAPCMTLLCHAGADMPTDSSEQVQVAAAKLQEQGVKSVLAKLGSKGSLLVKEGGQVLKQDILKADKVRMWHEAQHVGWHAACALTSRVSRFWLR